jgi:hypothetical protein
LRVGKKRELEDNGAITVEQARKKQQKIGPFDSMEAFALNSLRIRTMFDDCVAEGKKWWQNEP